jgi:seryl-tRNA(Sec) selenium transferase
MLRQDAARLQQEIANLYLQFPELREDDEVLRVDMLEGATSLKELAAVILDGIGDARALYDGTKIRMEELKARQGRFKMRGEFLRAMLLRILQHAEVRKLELAAGTVSVKAGARQIIGEPDPATLPDELVRITREPDKIKIRERLLAGEAVEGFTLSNGEPTLAVHGK